MRFLAIPAAALMAACVQMTPITDAKPVALSAAQVEQIKQSVTSDFFDPGSAQFRAIRAVDVTLQDDSKARRVCGEVNGKNRMGGYVGFNMFGGTMQNGRFAQEDFFSPCEPF